VKSMTTPLLFVAVLSLAHAPPAAAQADSPSSGDPKTQSPPTDIAKQRGALSDKLDRNQGVIRPEGGVDPGMEKPAPQTGSMPVVRPPDPGKSGVEPK
jgi:hypothetical protein